MANINVNKGPADNPTSQTAQTASELKDKAKDTASHMADKARDMADTVSHKAGDAVSAAGHGLRSAAGAIRGHTPDSGVLGTASSRVADALDRGGRYLEEEKLSDMAEDVTNLVRRYPISALLIGFGVGFIVARTVSRG